MDAEFTGWHDSFKRSDRFKRLFAKTNMCHVGFVPSPKQSRQERLAEDQATNPARPGCWMVNKMCHPKMGL